MVTFGSVTNILNNATNRMESSNNENGSGSGPESVANEKKRFPVTPHPTKEDRAAENANLPSDNMDACISQTSSVSLTFEEE